MADPTEHRRTTPPLAGGCSAWSCPPSTRGPAGSAARGPWARLSSTADLEMLRRLPAAIESWQRRQRPGGARRWWSWPTVRCAAVGRVGGGWCRRTLTPVAPLLEPHLRVPGGWDSAVVLYPADRSPELSPAWGYTWRRGRAPSGGTGCLLDREWRLAPPGASMADPEHGFVHEWLATRSRLSTAGSASTRTTCRASMTWPTAGPPGHGRPRSVRVVRRRSTRRTAVVRGRAYRGLLLRPGQPRARQRRELRRSPAAADDHPQDPGALVSRRPNRVARRVARIARQPPRKLGRARRPEVPPRRLRRNSAGPLVASPSSPTPWSMELG